MKKILIFIFCIYAFSVNADEKKTTFTKEFLDFVHDIDLSFLEKDTALKYELENINLRKFVFTNGSHNHVKHITTTLGIDDQFEGIFDIVDAEADMQDRKSRPLKDNNNADTKKVRIYRKKKLITDS